MKTLEINKKSLLITLEAQEWKKYFPKGEFDLADRYSRKALRDMLSDACGRIGKSVSERIEIDAFGNSKTGFDIFVRYT